MATTLSIWEHPTTGEVRIYANRKGDTSGKRCYWICDENDADEDTDRVPQLQAAPGCKRVLGALAKELGLGNWWDAMRLAMQHEETKREAEAQALASMVAIHGNTYPIRNEIKALGGRWDAANKVWMVPPAVADEVRAMIPAKGRPSRPRKRTRCVECGGPLVDAPAHRAMGGYCGVCAFDEFDY